MGNFSQSALAFEARADNITTAAKAPLQYFELKGEVMETTGLITESTLTLDSSEGASITDSRLSE